MEATKRKSSGGGRAGSALILTVVLTVLLALIGVLFVMASRLGEMSTSSIADERRLDAAVDSVVGQINKVLVDDLYGELRKSKLVDGTADNEGFDSPVSDLWLASPEPAVNDSGTPSDTSDDTYLWKHISNIYSLTPLTDLTPNISDSSGTSTADADGDGVSDSVWVMMPSLKDSKGTDIYAAVRIIDNCAMLNLNTAYGIDADSDGRYLSSVNYSAFLRAYDRERPERIRVARDAGLNAWDIEKYHNEVVMKIENPNAALPSPAYQLFDIGDELEIRNRYLLTSRAIARFEKRELDTEARNADWPAPYSGIAYYTFDLGRGIFGYDSGAGFWEARTAGVPFDNINDWENKINPLNFDDSDPLNTHAFEYDRRHVCTFYSFDRNLRTGVYPVLDAVLKNYDKSVHDIFIPKGAVSVNFAVSVWDALDGEYDYEYNNLQNRKKILQLLYVLRAYFIAEESLPVEDAARNSAQFVANMIDYIDDNNPLTEGPFYDARFGDGTDGQSNENLTYINRDIIRELILEASLDALGAGNEIDIDIATDLDFGLDADVTVYGYERQPFISELYTDWIEAAPVPEDSGCQTFAIELINPYHNPNGSINLEGWRIKIGDEEYDLDFNFEVPGASDGEPGRLVIWSSISGSAPAGGDIEIPDTLTDPGMGLRVMLSNADVVELQRPDPVNAGQFITVDKTGQDQLTPLRMEGIHASKRDDTGWKFADLSSFMDDDVPTLGAGNGVSLDAVDYQMPVADNLKPVGTLGDFERVIFFSSETEVASDPNSVSKTVTEYMASAAVEGDVRFDVEQRRELLDYISFLNRDEGTLPGRINVNTATREVIRAAIPPKVELWDPNDLSADVVAYRDAGGTFADIMDLLNVPGFADMEADPNEQVGDLLKPDDIEERDWILSSVSNIFTTRSDVFTAYILVRLGLDGPERRVIAIFDRSNVDSPMDKPRVIAVHPVPAVR